MYFETFFYYSTQLLTQVFLFFFKVKLTLFMLFTQTSLLFDRNYQEFF
jgi:hypothetical protein